MNGKISQKSKVKSKNGKAAVKWRLNERLTSSKVEKLTRAVNWYEALCNNEEKFSTSYY
jgi:hypothetical protein